jgi:hypothetical protein
MPTSSAVKEGLYVAAAVATILGFGLALQQLMKEPAPPPPAVPAEINVHLQLPDRAVETPSRPLAGSGSDTDAENEARSPETGSVALAETRQPATSTPRTRPRSDMDPVEAAPDRRTETASRSSRIVESKPASKSPPEEFEWQ